uniref:cupin domain-containing protein n=1 Tax=Lysinibacillus fusiformis TaxID=28031 RepID=UPI0020BDCA42
KLGLNVETGEVPQSAVPKNTILGSSVEDSETFSLVGCMAAPGFDLADFELFTREELLADYPQHEGVIRKMAYKTIK